MKRTNNKSPWVTPSILKHTKKSQGLYRKWIVSRLPKDRIDWLKHRKITRRAIRTARKLYYSELTEAHRSNPKALWKIYNELRGKHIPPSALPPLLTVNESTIDDPNTIAKVLCKFFANIGTAIADKIPPSIHNASAYLPREHLDPLFELARYV
eukprot:Pompholyxophrys_punicea_v1_NODE_346_length_2198_cov_4.255131.p1 type:complete len:154 gc:universal NODE_346_length_2198_cov_4.255131:1346-885(-)